jgi:hypothetical protein
MPRGGRNGRGGGGRGAEAARKAAEAAAAIMNEPIFDILENALLEGTSTAQDYATAEARAKAAAKLLEPHFPKEVRAYSPLWFIGRKRERPSNQSTGLRP